MLTSATKAVKEKHFDIRVLIVEKNQSHRADILKMLSSERGEQNIVLSCSCSVSVIKKKLISKHVDVVLLGISESYSYDEFGIVFAKEKNLPVIGLVDSKTSVHDLKIDFQQKLMRTNLDRSLLVRAINSAVEQRNTKLLIDERVAESQNSEARFLNVILNNADGIVVVNKSRQVLFLNPAARQMLGMTSTNLKRNEFPYTVEPGLTKELKLSGAGKEFRVLEMRSVETLWERDAANLISLRDITSRKTAEEALRKSEERYALAIKGSKDGLWDWDLRTDRIFYCEQWKAMLGYSDTEIGDSPDEWFSRVHPADLKKVKKLIESHLEGNSAHFESEFRILNNRGTWVWMLARGTAVRNKKGKAIRIAGSLSDISERKRAERQLKKALDDMRFALASEKVLMEELDRKNKELVELSITDGLTGLYNHRFLQERFEFEFKRARRYGSDLSCIIIDIDHFKAINDTYGHQFGDFVIKQIATIMKTKSREIDICGRYGGEEFMIITNLVADDALKYASKLHTAIDNHIFEYGEHTAHVTVSMGIADYHADIKTKQELIERSDVALYQAKKDGRNLIRLWKENRMQDDKSIDKYGIQELKSKFADLSSQMRAAYMESTNALIKAVDAKDPFAREHSKNVSYYAVAIARYLHLSEQEIEVIRYGALLHDIGKISVRDEILVKKEKLTNKEFEILKKHPEVGVNILKEVKFLEKEIPIILYHHERYDGKGYPQGLKAREIPIGARIIAVVDAFDAMISGRTYKKQITWNRAIEELEKGKGTQFSPEVVDAFLSLIENGSVKIKADSIGEKNR